MLPSNYAGKWFVFHYCFCYTGTTFRSGSLVTNRVKVEEDEEKGLNLNVGMQQ